MQPIHLPTLISGFVARFINSTMSPKLIPVISSHCSYAGWFKTNLVKLQVPENRFSGKEAHKITAKFSLFFFSCLFSGINAE